MKKKYLQGYEDLTDPKTLKYKITNINYDLSGEEMTSEELEEVRKNLPQELVVEIYDTGDLEYELAEAISDETGWLVHSFNYEKIGGFILTQKQKNFIQAIYDDDLTDKIEKEWIITNDKSYDNIRTPSDDKAFPYCLLIDGKFYDALTKDYVDMLKTK